MRDIPNWVLLGVAAIGGVFLLKKFAVKFNAGTQEAGEKISEGLFRVLNPSLSKENYNKPTVVNAQISMDGNFKCPPGYRYKFIARTGEHLCFRDEAAEKKAIAERVIFG